MPSCQNASVAAHRLAAFARIGRFLDQVKKILSSSRQRELLNRLAAVSRLLSVDNLTSAKPSETVSGSGKAAVSRFVSRLLQASKFCHFNVTSGADQRAEFFFSGLLIAPR